MAKSKVRLIKQAGQTGLRVVGTILHVEKKIADRWISLGLVERITKPRKKKKADDKVEKDNNGK